MKIHVKNYRGIAEADLELAPLALVCAPNGGGKSSIAQAVAAALTRNPAVVDGVTKAGAEVLLRDGEKRGRCTVGDESGSVAANWPGASVSEDGTGPRASPIACGLQSLVDLPAKSRAGVLIDAMAALPTLEDLRAACPGVRAELLDAAWKRIQSDGWDAWAKRASERSASLKGAWEQITGERWGEKKGAGWQAAGYEDRGADVDGQLVDAQVALEAAVANQAANEAEVVRLRTEASKAEAAELTVRELEAQLNEHREAADKIQGELSAMPRPETPEQMVECPHCKGHLVVVSRTEVRAPSATVDAAENEAREVALASKRADLQVVNTSAQELRDQLNHWRQALSTAKRAQQQLDSQPAGTFTAEQVAEARARVEAARRAVQARNAMRDAAACHAEIIENNELVAALATNGVRQTVLAAKMAALRARLANLSAAAGWPVVALTDELSATLGGRAYGLLSASEQFRLRTVMQVTLAGLDGSAAVIVDAADILDRSGRNGLFAMLRKGGMRALVCMTMNDVKDVPDIAKAGLGRSYWIGGATLAPVGN